MSWCLVFVVETDCILYELRAGPKETVDDLNITIDCQTLANIQRKLLGTISERRHQKRYALRIFRKLF